MSGVWWLLASWGAIAVFFVVTAYRMWRIARLPVHLRWELAPIPKEKGKGRYGGSYLEDYEWWKGKRKTSRIAPLLYMAGEILFFRTVWRHNRSLWPFSLALHLGLYLVILALLVHLGVALARVVLHSAPQACLHAASLLALCGYALGSAGSVGLIVKRVLSRDLRWSSTPGAFLNLGVFAAVFLSGLFAWGLTADPATAMNLFVTGFVSFDGSVTVAWPLAVHLSLLLICCVYLPFTSMVHFAAKYFMYHGVRWDDEPLDEEMERELKGLLSRSVTWGEAGGPVTWGELAGDGDGHEKA